MRAPPLSGHTQDHIALETIFSLGALYQKGDSWLLLAPTL